MALSYRCWHGHVSACAVQQSLKSPFLFALRAGVRRPFFALPSWWLSSLLVPRRQTKCLRERTYRKYKRHCPQNMRGGMKKQKLDKEKDRDISEKIALGMHKGGGAKGGADL